VSDLGFIAEARDTVPGFRVLAGGGMGGNSRVGDELLTWTPASQVIRIAEAVRRLFDQHGDRGNKRRARLRFVFERLGLDAIKQQFADLLDTVTAEGVPEWQGGASLREAAVSGPVSTPRKELIGGVWAVRQRQDGLVALPLHLPLGFVPAGDFARIGAIAARFSAEQGPRTMRSQNLVIRSIKIDDLPALIEELRTLETDVVEPAALERFVACAGASTCRLGLCLARGAARASAAALAAGGFSADTLQAMQIYINGCPNACGHQPIGSIGFAGAAQRHAGRLVPSYRVSVGGRCGTNGAQLGVPVGQLPALAMPALLCDIARDFEAQRDADEMFSEYVERHTPSHFEALVAQHSEVPAYDDRPEYYRDFGVAEDFSLAGRGAGECGSGVFEVIQGDLAAARKATAPFDILVPTARALLITRGIDAQDPDTVLREFESQFIDTGLVADEFRALLTRARGFTQGWQDALDGMESSVTALLERVELLYSTLDGNLEFHPPQPVGSSQTSDKGEATTTPPADAIPELDLSGVACPMNFVKAKLRLETMGVGETLAVVLDEGEPIENVPASFRSEGQVIDETTDLGDGRWRIAVIKKR